MTQDKSFIEVQFPVSKVSKESYKERKAGPSQTLTGIGKWWGRKPLVLVRAAILGLLMPASNDQKKDMEVFLKIMTMDKNGLLQRRNKPITARDAIEYLTCKEQLSYFECKDGKTQPKYKKELSEKEKNIIIETVWARMSYDQKLNYCLRPEDIENQDNNYWSEINKHLKTNASCLQELICELGEKRFGRRAVVGDCFCGGGSIPFEAMRLGCDTYGADLNPIAALLTWASLNLLSKDAKKKGNLVDLQQQIIALVEAQVKDWKIEENEEGARADYYLYCTETVCPECGWLIPMLPSLVVGRRMDSVIVELIEDTVAKRYRFKIHSGCSEQQMNLANTNGTVRDGALFCPHCIKKIPLSSIRKDRKGSDGERLTDLRFWEKDEFKPRQNDIFTERLYAIKWAKNSKRWYAAPTEADEERELKVSALLTEFFSDWQENGYIPSSEIESGDETSRLAKERGWKYWHHLFNERQLLINGLIIKTMFEQVKSQNDMAFAILLFNRILNFNSKLCRWNSARDFSADVFYNQALNTLLNYGVRGLEKIKDAWDVSIILPNATAHDISVSVNDARVNENICDLWITDPPYADAVNYHELSEFFLAWDKKLLKKAFPEWYTDSKRVLAVRGRDETFNSSMIEIYKNLAQHMPNNGFQIIMFTHQDVNVWADLTLIVWSAGLQVTAAWNIATETDASGLKDGNYVKGTVLLVLRKQTTEATAYLDDIYPDIEDEVKRQIQSMQELDEQEEPNFFDADYILAAYAASLKVLTSYKKIEDIDVQYELTKQRKAGELSPIARLIESATKIAYDQLIPAEFDKFIWKTLAPEERLYIKGLELEKHNIYQLAAYQELARGFGVPGYKDLLASAKANTARFKTAAEFGNRNLNDDMGFGPTLLRQVLMALYLIQKEGNVQSGKNWLRNEITDYWDKRERIGELLQYLATLEHIDNMAHWHEAAASANILKELVANDGI
jgi:putative DNA methylase